MSQRSCARARRHAPDPGGAPTPAPSLDARVRWVISFVQTQCLRALSGYPGDVTNATPAAIVTSFVGWLLTRLVAAAVDVVLARLDRRIGVGDGA